MWLTRSGGQPAGRTGARRLQPDCSRRRLALASDGGRAELKAAGSMTGGRATTDTSPSTTEPVDIRPTVAPSTLKYRLIAADALVVAVAVVLAFVLQSIVRTGAQLGVQRSHLVL